MFGFLKKAQISYSIVTYPRPAGYLDQTIKSLDASGFFKVKDRLPLRLVSGSPDSSHLDPYLSDKRFLVDHMTPDEAIELHWFQSGGGLRAIKAHRRALHPLRVNPGAQFVLVMEDDIKFAKGWVPRLEKTLKKVIKKYSDRFLLTLYSAGDGNAVDGVLTAYRAGRFWVERPSGFYGVQAVLYPTIVRDAYMVETAVRPVDQEREPGQMMDRSFGHPHDLLLPRIVKQLGIPVLATAPSLVQHIGIESGADSPQHHSNSFIEQVG